MTKEEAYDSRVAPLMTQVIAICKEHKIPVLASFCLDLEEGLHCTTALLADEYEPSDKLLAANRQLQHRSPMMITTKNGKGEVTSIEAIL